MTVLQGHVVPTLTEIRKTKLADPVKGRTISDKPVHALEGNDEAVSSPVKDRRPRSHKSWSSGGAAANLSTSVDFNHVT